MRCPPKPQPEPELQNHQSYCPKAWSHQQRVRRTRHRKHSRDSADWIYPKYFSEWFTRSPSASCFAPSAVMLLLPSLKQNREVKKTTKDGIYIYIFIYILTVWRGSPSCSSAEKKSAACKHQLVCCWRVLTGPSGLNTVISTDTNLNYYFKSWQYLRNVFEVITLDAFSNQFANPLICNVIVPEAFKGKHTLTPIALPCSEHCHCALTSDFHTQP